MSTKPLPANRMATIVGVGLLAAQAAAQNSPHAGMLRYPDVSQSHIVFSYANDLWMVPKSGGAASRLSSPAGAEMFAKFSPDGQTIVFNGNYDGGRDLYTMSVNGGTATRITHHPSTEVISDWSADGRIVYFANGQAGLQRQTQIFTVGADGGLPEKLPVPYGAVGAISGDGEWLAYTPHTRDNRTWKRYRGGMATDIWLFNLETMDSRKITDWEGTDTMPMWHGTKVYYLSDNGPESRLNIWSYDVETGRRAQVTEFSDYDVKYPAIGPGDRGEGEIVFQNGSSLHLLDLGSGRAEPVLVTIPGDRPKVREHTVDASEHVGGGGLSATGKRIVVEARGDIFTVPAENGAIRQLTDTSGAAERTPAWSPDGRWVAYFSDESGEYELYVTQSDGKGETRKLTSGNETYFFSIYWAPNSEKLAITDKAGNIILVNAETGEQRVLDRDEWAGQPGVDWSKDSRYITYAKPGDAMASAIWIYDTEENQRHQVTSGFFNDTSPAFSRNGDYLYYASNRDFSSPEYEDVGLSFIYANTGKLIAVPLNADVEYPWGIEADEETWEEETEENASDEGEESEDEAAEEESEEPKSPIHGVWSGKVKGLSQIPGMTEDEIDYRMTIIAREDGSFVGSSESMGETAQFDSVTFDEDTGKFTATRSQGPITQKMEGTLSGESIAGTWNVVEMGISGTFEVTKTDEEPDESGFEDEESDDAPVEIDFEDFEARGMELPVGSGNFVGLVSNDKGHLIYMRMGDGMPAVKLIDITADEPSEKTVIAGAQMVGISADGKKLLVAQGPKRFGIVNASAGQSLSSPINPSGLMKTVDPREEWEQIFTDAWRRHRDFFYVENLHGVDWDAVYEQYSAMLADAASREDVSFIIGEMIGELNVGHAYYWGGDGEDESFTGVGMLGCDFEVASETDDAGNTHTAYRISKVYEGADWDSDARGPLSRHGLDVGVGTYVLAVNGRPIDTARDPWAAFVGTTGDDTTITFADALVGDEETRNERDVTLRPIGSEANLRYRAWIEANRKRVEEATDGRVGYIYVPDTGVNGQNNLFRQFYGQIGKEALIIDERWNGGGQIPTRFIELLNRPRTNYWARRDGKDWPWPPDSHQGPKCMLINGLAGSGGDMFPWLFKHNELGKLIGTRTWGGLVGISGVPGLIDGGYTAVPTFGFYETDGTWGIEGHGVDPDIEVIDDPSQLARGTDPQLNAAIELMLSEIGSNGYRPADRPADPDRSGMGITDDDK